MIGGSDPHGRGLPYQHTVRQVGAGPGPTDSAWGSGLPQNPPSGGAADHTILAHTAEHFMSRGERALLRIRSGVRTRRPDPPTHAPPNRETGVTSDQIPEPERLRAGVVGTAGCRSAPSNAEVGMICVWAACRTR